VILEEGKHEGVEGWGWNDHDYGDMAAPIYFDAPGIQTIRIQQREDGISFDQIVLSPWAHMSQRPGATKNCSQVVPKQ
jgi:hypothetical protein